MGATIKSQTWLKVSPPTKSAGPILLAGFTDTPVTGMPTIWISVKLKPIAFLQSHR